LEGVMIAVAINDASQVAEARREATAIAEQNGFNGADAGRAALVTTELATNLIKHGGGGEILLGAYQDSDGGGVEVLALDRGRGMANVEACLRDGYSSAGTAGNGLGAVIRQSHFVDVASWQGVGTAVLSRIAAGQPKPERVASHSGWGAVSIAMPGEAVCGDSWTVSDNGNVQTLFVADGLGHGQDAAEASVEAVRLFHRLNGHQVPTLLDYVHGGLRSTRGAAVSIARFDPAARRLTFAGVGNVAGVIAANGNLKRMVSMPGTAGHIARKIQSFEYPFDGGLVILHSDGLTTSWTLARYPNLHTFHPTLVAAILYRDFARRRDDATVLVGKWVADPSTSPSTSP
jgi:anti-sigma regulatory factor (Ser/Thr protein kinase)